MKKSTLGIIIAVAVVVAVAGATLASRPKKDPMDAVMSNQGMSEDKMAGKSQGGSGSGEMDLTAQAEVAMDIKDFEFSQPKIKIKKGTKVTWTNQDKIKHNAFSDASSGPKGQLLAQGESYSFVFDTAGTIKLHL